MVAGWVPSPRDRLLVMKPAGRDARIRETPIRPAVKMGSRSRRAGVAAQRGHPNTFRSAWVGSRSVTLVGRGRERRRLRLVLDSARRRRADVVVLEGPPGCGKSALIDQTIGTARDMTLMACAGVMGERDLPFGSLLTLLRPHLGELDALSEVQRDALRGALALAPPTMADRLAIGVAVLELIGLLAERAPLLVAVDDLQWVDAASRDAILFALRRVRHDRVAALLGLRAGADVDLRGFEILPIGPLSRAESIELLQSRHPWSAPVAAELARRCEWNPLTLIEVGEMVAESQRRGGERLPDRLPAGSATVRLFRDQIRAVPPQAGFALLVAALSHDPGQAQVAAACLEAGSGEPDWAALEAARLIVRRTDRLEFTHPLVRSAVIELSDPLSIRRAHLGLAGVVTDSNRRTWHRAEAATGTDEEIAEALGEMAVDALVLGDSSASVRAAARAAELTPDAEVAASRWLLAAGSAAVAGLDPATYIERARAGPSATAAEAMVILAASSAWSGQTQTLRQLLRTDLPELERENRTAAALVCAFAAIAAFNEMDEADSVALSERAWSLADERFDIAHPFGLMPAISLGMSTQFGGDRLREVDECRRLVAERGAVDLATPVAVVLLGVDRHVEALEFAQAMHAVAVREGRVVAAAWTATAAAMASHLMGDLPSAVRWSALGRELGQAAGVPYVVAQATSLLAVVAALRGDREQVAALTSEVDTAPLCDAPVPTIYVRRFAAIVDEVNAGSLEAAAVQLRAFPEVSQRMVEYWPVTYELVEVLVRLDRIDEARSLLPALTLIEADRFLRHQGQVERCRGLLAPADRFDHHFQEAIRLLAAGPRRLELARARLCYGERLVRVGRRRDALEPLHAALQVFDANGCRPWADRARAGLSTAGGNPSRAPRALIDRLTTQEEQVASAVASGMTNREAAAALFVSSKTIETHLTRIYRKLEVRSRTELANAMAGR